MNVKLSTNWWEVSHIFFSQIEHNSTKNKKKYEKKKNDFKIIENIDATVVLINFKKKQFKQRKLSKKRKYEKTVINNNQAKKRNSVIFYFFPSFAAIQFFACFAALLAAFLILSKASWEDIFGNFEIKKKKRKKSSMKYKYK